MPGRAKTKSIIMQRKAEERKCPECKRGFALREPRSTIALEMKAKYECYYCGYLEYEEVASERVIPK